MNSGQELTALIEKFRLTRAEVLEEVGKLIKEDLEEKNGDLSQIISIPLSTAAHLAHQRPDDFAKHPGLDIRDDGSRFKKVSLSSLLEHHKRTSIKKSNES